MRVKVTMEQVEYFDRETETYQDGEVTFRNGAYIEVEDREGNKHYPDPWDITWSERN
jgi:hypothetical protein